MSIKRTLIAALAAAFAFAALPAVASAGLVADIDDEGHFEVHSEPNGGTYPLHLDSPDATIGCQTVTGKGEFDVDENSQAQTGTIKLTIHGCKGPLGVTCTSHGQPTGTITTTELTFHLVTGIHTEDPEDIVNAVLITPNEVTHEEPHETTTHFASFTCSFLASVNLGGTGIIGEITGNLSETVNSITVDFDGNEEHGQTYKTIVGDEEETVYRLESSVNEGEFKPALKTAQGVMAFTEGQTGTLTSSTE